VSDPETVVVTWNKAALEAIQRSPHPGPPQMARALAILHTCIYDAWAAYDPVALGTQLGGTLRRPPAERTPDHKHKAISFAAYRALVDLFPSVDQVAAFDGVMSALGYNPTDTSIDTTTASGIGNVAAQAVLTFRHNDGANQLGDLHPGAYADHTGYVPVNVPGTIVDANRWQPLDVPNTGGTAIIGAPANPCHTSQDVAPSTTAGPGVTRQTYIGPHWGLVIPFALTSGAQLRPPTGPEQHGTSGYQLQADQILAYSATLTDEQKVIAEYWADGPTSELPPGHWCLFAQCASSHAHHDLDADVTMFFALTNAIFDASIACWEAKRAFDSIRPVTAVDFVLYRDPVTRTPTDVFAWAGPYQGPKLIKSVDWRPYQAATVVTPPFPEYVSGHSTFSSAAAEVLKRATGSDTFGGQHTQKAGTSRVEPKDLVNHPGHPGVPATDVTLFWATFSDAADQAGISRRYGGIHFVEADVVGRAMGRSIGARAWDRAQAYVTGQLHLVMLSDLATANPNIVQQVQDWQAQRRASGQDQFDWAAFRKHVQGIGAPDPGEPEPEDFRLTVADLVNPNPNIVQQVRAWQTQRRASGQDPYDWAALRQHIQAIGGPDPGQREPEDFNLHAFWPISS